MRNLIRFMALSFSFLFGQSLGYSINYYQYEDLTYSPKYREVMGREFKLMSDFLVFAKGLLESDRVVDGPLGNHSMTAYDGPAQGGRGLQYFGRLPKGTNIRIVRVVELNSKTPVYWAEVMSPPSRKYQALRIRISQEPHLNNYSRKSYPRGARKLNEAFFEELPLE